MRNKSSLLYAALVILLTCSFQLQLFVNVIPKCVCDAVMVMGIPFIKSVGCCGGFFFNVKIIERVFEALKFTSLSTDQVEIKLRS